MIFDPETIYDNAAYVDEGAPDAPPEGIDWVIVNGKVAVKGKEIVNDNCGGALKLYRACKSCAGTCKK